MLCLEAIQQGLYICYHSEKLSVPLHFGLCGFCTWLQFHVKLFLGMQHTVCGNLTKEIC